MAFKKEQNDLRRCGVFVLVILVRITQAGYLITPVVTHTCGLKVRILILRMLTTGIPMPLVATLPITVNDGLALPSAASIDYK